jgi:ATP-binding cassette, subfamily B, multidrug efflux pump
MSSDILKFSKRYAAPLWPWYLVGSIMLAAVNLVALEIPQLIKQIVNTLTLNGDMTQTQNIAYMIIGMGFTLMIVRALSRILIFWPGRKIEASLKAELFEKTLHLPQRILLKFGMGDLISRLANDVGQVRVLFAFGLLQLINMIFLLVFTISKMYSSHPGLTIACIIPCSLMIFVTRYAAPKMGKYSKIQQQALGRLTNRVTESYVNIHVIQSNTAEESFLKLAEIENETVFKTNIRLVFIRTTMFIMMPLFAAISQLIILIYGGSQVMDGSLTVGDLLAFNIYIGLLMFPLTSMGFLIAIYQRAKTAIERLIEIGDAESETTSASTTPLSDQTLLSVKNLNFVYPVIETSSSKESDQFIAPVEPFSLKNISFTIKHGEKIGIFGPIGSGKTTLFNTISRLFDPPAGSIYWNGNDVMSLVPSEYRGEMGYALQTVHLFSATIRENLSFGLENVTQDQLDEAARAAQILDEIKEFDLGWNTEIGEKGVRLSGGQKQRLALARLLIRKPPLLILDDVLSAVDHTTEQNLINEMFKLGGAILIASHRASSIKPCDSVLIIENGEIVDRGSFEQMAAAHPELDQQS